ncbi:hypothetical protein GXW83_15075 [Streptacidiphilus sp. PB12-B1b]|uniref:hypothetical protein n=1 Tax=Streptacidiphilus sp. PB12-B1b TaxID=2705012 RepID=UPI0015FCAE88|nr:hypothetical protein [Streptacidiphilus sp. PB12-B1b]QMU76858.1 hypothetical protein GXW83_15075 [Streptacidiphilus sp. PB12-B1b]
MLPPRWLASGRHLLADRRRPLQAMAEAIGAGGFYRLGAPRPGHDDNPSFGATAGKSSWR